MEEIKKYLAYDNINDMHEPFDTLKEAKDYLTESILVQGEGYMGDISEVESCCIYELKQTIKVNVISPKEDYEEDEWKDMGGEGYDEMWEHKFINKLTNEQA